MAAKRAFVGVQTRLAAERFDDYHQIHIFGAARADRREVHGGLQEGLRWSVRSAPITHFFRDALTSVEADGTIRPVACYGIAIGRHRTNDMDRSDEFRRAATQCLALAQKTTDQAARLRLLTMAQKWFAMANGSPSEGAFNAALRTFNDDQMIPV
jgi:hypothetical protein